MADLDDELAALEAEIENENKGSGGNQNKYSNNANNSNSNMNMNIGSNNTSKQSYKNNYNNYGNGSDGLENFLSDKNNNYGNNNYQNNNFNNYYNQRGNYNNNNNNNYNNYNNYNNNNYNNNPYNNNYNNYNNNPYNNNYNNNFNNNYNQQMNRQNMNNNANMNNMNRQNQNYQNIKQNPMQYNQNSTQVRQQQQQSQQTSKPSQQMPKPSQQMLKPIPKQSQQPPKQSQQQQEQRQSKLNQNKKPEINSEPQEDIYPEKQENMYHKVEEMKSLTVLEEEIALCNKIIEFKKKRGLDYDDWETKKDMAEVKINSTKALIESGKMDFEDYKKLILTELQYEKKILKFTEMDKKSKPNELKEIKRRIEQRIEVINKELTQNIDEEDNDEEEKKEVQNEPNNTNNQKKSQLSNKSKNIMQQPPNQNMNEPGPEDSDTRYKTTLVQPGKNQQQIQHQHQNQNQNMNARTQVIQPKNPGQNLHNIPPQYIIQKKVIVTDPKTGKQMYAYKNVVDPRYEQMLKQNQAHQPQPQPHNQPQPQNQNPHIIQQKVLVTDPKTGKPTYVIRNVPDPRYAQPQNQMPVPKNQANNLNPKTAVQMNQNQAGTQVLRNPNTQIIQNKNVNVKQPQQAQPVPQNSNNEEIQKYKQYINALIKEYTEAKEYFKKTGFEKQLAKSREDLKILASAKQKVDMGRYKDVKLNTLPKPITPEYIFGYTENERMEKFKAILTQYIKDKNEIEQKMKSILEKLQKLKRKELEKAKDAVKPKLDELKTKKEQIIKIIDALKEKFKDKWTPAPEFKKVAQQEQVEKISYEGCKYGLKIKAGKTDYDKDKTFLVLLLEVNKSKTLKKQVNLKQDGDFNEEWIWEFTADEWKNIPKTFLYVELYREHTFSTDKKGSGKVDLNNIRRGTAIKNDCKIEIESKRVEPIVNFVITPILPEGKKYYETVSKEAIKITKTYPAFTGKQHIQFESTKPSPTAPATTTPTTHQGQNVKPPEKAKGNAPANTTGGGSEQIIDKSKFKPEELEDVDILDNLNSLKVLDYKVKELEMKIKKIDGRTPREMLQKKVKMNCKKKQLEEGMGDGSISPKDYMEFMRIQLEHDQLLAMYMKQNNQEEKMKAVLTRVTLLKQEMEELKKYVN